MSVGVFSSVQRRMRDPRERLFIGGVLVLFAVAIRMRVSGFSSGSFFRDDAWVALTSRVPWHDAWRMVGTAPGFVLFERFWVGLTGSFTMWAQVPTFLFSIAAIPLAALVARYWGLKRSTSLFVAALLAVSRIDVQYATHLKPYAVDVISGLLVLASTQWWRRGQSPWPFAVISLVSVAISFTVVPFVVGCGLLIAFEACRSQRWRTLIGPGAVVVVPISALYWLVSGGISSKLRESWAPNFVSFHSVSSVFHSVRTIVDGLVWGFSDTTLHWHIAGFSKLVLFGVLLGAVIGASKFFENAPAIAALLVAGIFAVAHLAPLGTGRTDAYLYPALALLVASGVERVVSALGQKRLIWARIGVALVALFSLILIADRMTFRPTYPGGSISPVAVAAQDILSRGGGVLIEGTARWPWTYYNVVHVRLVFSTNYNTGFAPLSDNPRVVIMPGTTIEGGYDPTAAVARLVQFPEILYVRTDDWPGLGDPLGRALQSHCYFVTQRSHPAGFLLEWLARNCAHH